MTPHWKSSLLLIICIVALALSHKLPIFALTILLFVLVIEGSKSSIAPELNRLFFISAMLLIGVWAITSEYIANVVHRGLFLAEGLNIQRELYEPSAAVRVETRPLTTFRRHVNWIVISTLAGISWTYILIQDWRKNRCHSKFLPVLACAAILMVLSAVAIASGSTVANPIRIIALAEPVLVAFVALLTIRLVDAKSEFSLQLLGFTLVVLVIISQTVALGGMIDEPDSPRSHLTSAEQDAFGWTLHYTPSSSVTYTDAYLVRAGVDPNNLPRGYWSRQRGAFQYFEPAVFNGSFVPRQDRVLYRTNVEIYGHLPWGGYWELTWNPEVLLDKCLNKVYSSGDATHYTRDHC